MNRSRLLGLAAILIGLVSLVVADGGCQAIVKGDVPEFVCLPGTDACPPGKVCGAAGQCIAACPDTPCAAGRSCVTGLCVDTDVPDAGTDSGPEDATVISLDAASDAPTDVLAEAASPPGEVGSRCAVHTDCMDGLCGDTSILTDAVINSAKGAMCTKPCCRSEECPDNFVCFGAGTGGSYCVNAAILPRGADAGTLGTTPGGRACTVGSACRSGVCAGGKCADSCCSSSDCGDAGDGGGLCRRETVDGHQVHACGTLPANAIDDGTACASSPKCASGLCVGPDILSSFCRPRCCNQKSCTSNPNIGAGSSCAYLAAQPTTESLTGCFADFEIPTGNKNPGDVCTKDGDCKTAFCALGSVRLCTDVCCVDADCSTYPKAHRCRPAASPNPHYLTCQP